MSDHEDKDAKIRELEEKLNDFTEVATKVAREGIAETERTHQYLALFLGLASGIFIGYFVSEHVLSDPKDAKDEFIKVQRERLKNLELDQIGLLDELKRLRNIESAHKTLRDRLNFNNNATE